MDQPQQPTTSPEPPASPQSNQQPSSPTDVQENKLIAAIGYLGILCFVPLLLKKDSPYAQFHGKQGLVLLIAWVILSFVMIIPFLGWVIGFLGYVVAVILMIVGIANALKGEMKELPMIGEYGKKLNL